jgi:acyl-CoA reductase-like NAD-dependent aldehyde dehydrogenase
MRTMLIEPEPSATTQAEPPAEPSWLRATREAQCAWASLPVRKRAAMIDHARVLLLEQSQAIAQAAADVRKCVRVEAMVSEVLPLLDAMRFAVKQGPGLLKPRKQSSWQRPLWLTNVDVTIHREPHGLVLVLGPGNYPLLLTGVQVVQALIAGNAVALKPAPGCTEPMRLLRSLLLGAGLPPELFVLLSEDVSEAQRLMRSGVADKVVLTGSSGTGRAVLSELAQTLTPATMELSGCDAVFVLPGADVTLVAKALKLGVTLNSGNTCIAPRRVYGPAALLSEIRQTLLRSLPDGQSPASLSFVDVDDVESALKLAAGSRYALGATIFGPPATAQSLARQVNAGCVVINDMIVPTADPRVPFGGRGESGFGVTRGAEGLLEMTRIKAVITRQRGPWVHLDPLLPEDEPMLSAYLRLVHGPGSGKVSALLSLVTQAFRGGARSRARNDSV